MQAKRAVHVSTSLIMRMLLLGVQCSSLSACGCCPYAIPTADMHHAHVLVSWLPALMMHTHMIYSPYHPAVLQRLILADLAEAVD